MSIRVDREIFIHTDDHIGSGYSSPPSVISVVRSTSEMRRDAKTPDPSRNGTPPLRLNGVFRHPDVREDALVDLLDAKQHEDSLRYLIDFLQKTPPPDNLMSTPDDYSSSSSEDNKWNKFKAFRKKRKGRGKKRRRPPIIQLPDSAVAAKTIGGHRHIAISIPFEHSHLGPISASQYPVESMAADFAREMESRLGAWGPPRTFPNDRAVVTVLKPVAEDRESLSSGSNPTSLRLKSSMHPERTSSLQGSPPMVSPAGERLSSLRGTARPTTAPARHESFGSFGYIPAEAAGLRQTTGEPGASRAQRKPKVEKPNQPRSEPSASTAVRRSHSRNASLNSNASSGASAGLSEKVVPPSRKSSKKANTKSDTREKIDSIDKILSHHASAAPKSTLPSHGPLNEGEKSKDVLPVPPAQAPERPRSIPIVVRPPSRQEIDSPLNLNFPTPPKHSVSRSVQTDMTLPDSATETTMSRKDRVRQKKKRDMQVMKAQQESVPAPRLLKPGALDVWPESPVLGHFSPEAKSSSRASSLTKRKPNLTPIMVGAPSEPNLPKHSPTKILDLARRDSKGSQTSLGSTPPASPGSPPINYDRTSFQRRKERQAEREAHQARKARYAAQAAADHRETTERLSRQELLERYESLKELRVHDMEKRLRRLERNSSVWIRSMVPLMENLTRLLQEQYEFQRTAANLRPTTAATPRPSTAHLDRRPEYLRSFRSHESILEPSRPRPHTAAGETRHRRRPPSLHLGERPSSGHRRSAALRAVGHRPPIPSPLQEEFEKELEERRATEERDEDLDARMRETKRPVQSQDTASDAASAAGTGDDYSSSDSGSSASGLDTIEPLMRELQGAARFSMERSSDDTPTHERDLAMF